VNIPGLITARFFDALTTMMLMYANDWGDARPSGNVLGNGSNQYAGIDTWLSLFKEELPNTSAGYPNPVFICPSHRYAPLYPSFYLYTYNNYMNWYALAQGTANYYNPREMRNPSLVVAFSDAYEFNTGAVGNFSLSIWGRRVGTQHQLRTTQVSYQDGHVGMETEVFYSSSAACYELRTNTCIPNQR
jgi:hypothetical protein